MIKVQRDNLKAMAMAAGAVLIAAVIVHFAGVQGLVNAIVLIAVLLLGLKMVMR